MSGHYRIDVDTAALRSAQDRWSGLAQEVGRRASTLEAAPGSMPVWQGGARTAVMSEVGALAGHARGFVPLITAAVDALGPFITAAEDAEAVALPALDRRRQAALDAFEGAAATAAAARTSAYEDLPVDGQRRMWQMEADTTHQHRVSEAAAARDGELERIDLEYEELVRDLERLAEQASEGIGAAVVTVAPDQTTADALGGGGQLPLVEAYYRTAESHRAGIDAAHELLEQGTDASTELLQHIQENQDDPAFAAAFAATASPADLASLVVQWSSLSQDPPSPSYDGSPDDVDTRYAMFLDAVSTTLGTATRGTGEHAPPRGYTQQWVDLLTGPMTSEGGDVMPGHSSAGALLLSRGAFSTPFSDRVATAVYDFEREAGADGGEVWGPRTGDSELAMSYTTIYGPDGSREVDVLSNVMQALGRNPEAAQAFLDGGGTTGTTLLDQDVAVQERLQYLLQERRWPDDDADGLGAALVAATTVERGLDQAGETSARLASQTFALAGEVDQPGADGRSLQEGLRDDMALMLGSYGDDLAAVLAMSSTGRVDELGGSWTHEDQDTGGHGVVLTEPHLEGLVETIGSGGSEDLAVVLAGVATATNARTDEILARTMAADPDAGAHFITDKNIDRLDSTLGNGASAVNRLITIGFDGEGDAEEQEDQRREFEAGVFTTVASIPLPGGPWVGYGVAQLTGAFTDAYKNPDAPAISDYAAEQDTAEDLASTAAMNSLLRHGYLSPEAYAAAGRPHEAPPPEILTTAPDGQPTFTFGTDAYTTWLDSGETKLYPWVRDTITNPHTSGGSGVEDPD